MEHKSSNLHKLFRNQARAFQILVAKDHNFIKFKQRLELINSSKNITTFKNINGFTDFKSCYICS